MWVKNGKGRENIGKKGKQKSALVSPTGGLVHKCPNVAAGALPGGQWTRSIVPPDQGSCSHQLAYMPQVVHGEVWFSDGECWSNRFLPD